MIPSILLAHHQGISPLKHTIKNSFSWMLTTTVIILTMIFGINQVSALPYNFHTTQGDLEYQEIITDHFRVYFDARVPKEGLMVAESLEAIKPLMDWWLRIARDQNQPLKIISSPVTRHASFANFIYDAIELQTQSQNIRDLTWHEYIHVMTYEFCRNFLSPPGTIFHVLWMPAWFLEGLAEALSVSIGSDYQSGIERWQALSGNWPSYDRLHSLYLNAKWSLRGYATAGSFVSWIMRESFSNKSSKASIHGLLAEFQRETMPWRLLVNFFNPMDYVLKKNTNKSGYELYRTYKKQAKAYWLEASPYPLLASSEKPRYRLPSGNFHFYRHQDQLHIADSEQRYQVNFDKKSGWASSLSPFKDNSFPRDALKKSWLKTPTFEAYIFKGKKEGHYPENQLAIRVPSHNKMTTIFVGHLINHLFHTKHVIGWVNTALAATSICYIQKKHINYAIAGKSLQPKCEVIGGPGVKIKILGLDKDSNNQDRIRSLWYRLEHSSLTGDTYQIKIWQATSGTMKSQPWHPLLKPINVMFAAGSTWVLSTDRTRSYLVKTDPDNACLETIHFSDFILQGWGLARGYFALQLYEGFQSSLIMIQPSEQNKYPCPTPEPHSSPMLDGIRILTHHLKKHDYQKSYLPHFHPKQLDKNRMPSLEEVLFRTHPWKIRHLKESTLQYISSKKVKDKNQGKAQDNVNLNSGNLLDRVHYFQSLSETVLSHKERHLTLLHTPPFGKTSKLFHKNHSYYPEQKDAQPYSFRWSSPVFFPWIGPNDFRGPQVGMISVPFIDDLQNHTLRGTLLIGLRSFYPDIDLTYTNHRFSTPIELGIFRKLTYDGHLTKTGASYLDEYGVRMIFRNSHTLGKRTLLRYLFGWRTSHLDLYTQPEEGITTPTSIKNEPFASLSVLFRLPWQFHLSLSGTVYYPSQYFNDYFDYYRARLQFRITKILWQ
ncbi:MAG: hypothetical protein OXC40_05635, partial [Proteobacteria bacterium]|nr:hypothetical protein [Pseudomonadota bacterium]